MEYTARITLDHHEPIDASGLFRWFETRALAGVEVSASSSYARALRLAHGVGILRISSAGDRLEAELWADSATGLTQLEQHARRLFDLDADTHAIDGALEAHTRLRPHVADTPGIRIPGLIDLHEALVRAVLGQQVTVASASSQAQRLVDELGETIAEKRIATQTGTELPFRLFPTAAVIAEHGAELFRGPASRRDTLVRACAAVSNGELSVNRSTPPEQLMTELQALKGIGPWTAGYVALRYLGSPDLMLTGDVAVRNGARIAGLGTDARELAISACQFAPWRSYLMMHLWRIAAKN